MFVGRLCQTSPPEPILMDLLVKLYELPAISAAADVAVRRAFAAEKTIVTDWIAQHFSRGWADECETAFTHLPVACFVATDAPAVASAVVGEEGGENCAEESAHDSTQDQLVGFACYNATARAFFGPAGVAESARGRGTGRAL